MTDAHATDPRRTDAPATDPPLDRRHVARRLGLVLAAVGLLAVVAIATAVDVRTPASLPGCVPPQSPALLVVEGPAETRSTPDGTVHLFGAAGSPCRVGFLLNAPLDGLQPGQRLLLATSQKEGGEMRTADGLLYWSVPMHHRPAGMLFAGFGGAATLAAFGAALAAWPLPAAAWSAAGTGAGQAAAYTALASHARGGTIVLAGALLALAALAAAAWARRSRRSPIAQAGTAVALGAGAAALYAFLWQGAFFP